MDDIAGRKALIKASGLKKGYILDVGLGACGCMSFFLAGKGFKVIGTDYSKQAVHDARVSAKQKKFKGDFQARLANAEKLPFTKNEFDAVIAYRSLHHISNVKKAIAEMFRVCKKNGFVLISDPNEKELIKYEHILDAQEHFKRIEVALIKYTELIKKAKTKHTNMFICKKY